MNANAIGIIGSIVDAHIAGCTEPKPCDACAADREALDRLARLVEAAGKALNADKRMNKPPNTIMRAEMLVDCQRAAIAELRQALSAVLGEETK